MPVPRSKRYDSEYARHYKEFEARRPNTVKGEPVRSLSHYNHQSNGSTPRAGLESSQLGTIHEPPLQRKRIVPYERNHNIFRTLTTKEEHDRAWLKRDDVSPRGSHSPPNRHLKEERTAKGKISVLDRSETPILAAEKKMLKEQRRNGHQPVYVPDRIKRKSTYKKDFVNYKKQSKTPQSRHKSKTKQRQSPHKVIGGKKDVSPDRLPPAGVRSATSLGDSRLLRPSDGSQYMRSPERDQPIKIFDSEYTSHYTQPTKFKFVDGLWVETPVVNVAKYSSEDVKKQRTPDWFNHVIDRRNEAYGYSHHARGTHFSRESLDEMNREQADRAESSRSDSQLSGYSPEDPRVKTRPVEKYDHPPRKREAWTETKSRSPTEPEHRRAGSEAEANSDDDGDMVFLERGRSPTPELRDTGASRRHHLDVTTNILNDSFHRSLNLSKGKKDSAPPREYRKETRVLSPREGGGRKKLPSPSSSVDLGSEAGSYAHQPPPRPEGSRKVPGSPASSAGGRDDDDVLSVSAMSSRASTASETLERARKRRDDFWKAENAGR